MRSALLEIDQHAMNSREHGDESQHESCQEQPGSGMEPQIEQEPDSRVHDEGPGDLPPQHEVGPNASQGRPRRGMPGFRPFGTAHTVAGFPEPAPGSPEGAGRATLGGSADLAA